MTIIIAKKAPGATVLAADWMVTTGETISYERSPKVRKFEILGSDLPAYIGFAGDISIASIISVIGPLPPFLGPENEPSTLWAERVARLFTQLLCDSPLAPVTEDSEGASIFDGEILMAVGDRIFYIVENAAVEPDDDVAAIGSGSDIALGYLAANPGLESIEVTAATVLLAVLAVCGISNTCGLGRRAPYVQRVPHTEPPIAKADKE